MGRDNSPKERQKQQLERKQATRASYDRILIVSEGSKTEPNYFKEIRSAYRLRTANIQVQPSEKGTSPLQVVQYTKKLFEKGDHRKQIQPRSFEQVYAVFDRDDHHSYEQALALATSLDGNLRNDNKQPIQFKAIASVPSFELWLLLHYEDVIHPIQRDVVIKHLKRYLPDYSKGHEGIFKITSHNLATAIERAKKLNQKFSANDAPEPHTGIVDLVTLLTDLNG